MHMELLNKKLKENWFCASSRKMKSLTVLAVFFLYLTRLLNVTMSEKITWLHLNNHFKVILQNFSGYKKCDSTLP